MERSREYDDIATALAELRPDAAAGLRRGAGRAGRDGLSSRGRAPIAHPWPISQCASARFPPSACSSPPAVTALAAIAIATIVVTSVDSGSAPVALNPHAAIERSSLPSPRPSSTGRSQQISSAIARIQRCLKRPALEDSREYSTSLPEPECLSTPLQPATARSSAPPRSPSSPSPPTSPTTPAKVFAAVHDADGIVLHSTTSSGQQRRCPLRPADPERHASATRLPPSPRSTRSAPGTRRPTTSPRRPSRPGEELQDSRARIDSLLAQLAAAETETERGSGRSRAARRAPPRGRPARSAGAAASTHHLLARLVRIESGASADSGGAWGIDDAFDDAGHILGIAAGVTLVGLAVVAPIALIASSPGSPTASGCGPAASAPSTRSRH